jgi:hypothetical protein
VPYARIRSLKCFVDVEEMLVSGYAAHRVADFIQKERGELTDIGRDYLAGQLTEFRNTELKPVQILSAHMTKVVEKAKGEFEDRLDDLRRLDKIYHLQMNRVDIGHELEKRLKILNKSLSGEIMNVASIIGQMHGIKMALGMHKETSSQGTIAMRYEIVDGARRRFGDDVADALMKPESRNRVLGVLAQFVGQAKSVDG